jgi:hypothetical protein
MIVVGGQISGSPSVPAQIGIGSFGSSPVRLQFALDYRQLKISNRIMELELPDETNKRSNNPEIRERINMSVGFATLLLAIVTFWTTARISGIEDYLRSEISRRNSDLDQLSQRSTSIEKLANERELQLAKLDASLSEVLSDSLIAQSDLGRLQTQSATSETKLVLAELSRQNINKELAEKSRLFEVYQKREAFERLSAPLFLVGYFSENLSGEALLEGVNNIPENARNRQVNQYIALSKTNFAKVCRSFEYYQPLLPEILPNPGNPVDRMISSIGNDREEVMAQDRRAISDWNERYERYTESQNAYEQARVSEIDRLVADAKDCLCQTLVQDLEETNQVCSG